MNATKRNVFRSNWRFRWLSRDCLTAAFVFVALFVWPLIGRLAAAESKLEFNRDVRPILADRCFRCHGPDSVARQSDLRLDQRESAVERKAIVPDQPATSLLVQRITAKADKRMPPVESGLKLTTAEIEVLRRWIEQGAEYQPHWAFIPPKATRPPMSQADLSHLSHQSHASHESLATWPRNGIDQFVLAELQRRGIRPAPEADRATVLRRVTLALTGLPPTIDELDSFAANSSPQAYEIAVDRLLASPRLAERLTLDWLDAARYADTIGHFTDFPRRAWPWRDWVLDAFQRNMPFDQFTIEQLAGDLLPDATQAQRIATGFNRNHTVTDETGVIDEEYRTSYVADRIETTATVWLGLTAGCARCHDHKYDPITQRDYFRMFAYFNNVPEKGLIYKSDNAAPFITLMTPELDRHLADATAAREQAERRWKEIEPAVLAAQAKWQETAKLPAAPDNGLAAHLSFDGSSRDACPRGQTTRDVGELKFAPGLRGQAAQFDTTQYVEVAEPRIDSDRPFSVSIWVRPTSGAGNCILTKLDVENRQRGFELVWFKNQPRVNLIHEASKSAIELIGTETFPSGDWHQIVVTYDGSRRAAGLRVFVDAEPQKMLARRDSLNGPIATDVPWQVAWKGSGLGFEGFLDELRIYERSLSAEEIRDLFEHDLLHGSIATPVEKRTVKQQERLRSRFLDDAGTDDWRQIVAELTEFKQREANVRSRIPSAAVMQEMSPPRETFMLTRGQYDQPADKVTSGIPRSLGDVADGGNRLAFARWLMSPDNPLTARVAVNRLWQQVFGEGLVRTPNDFGLQGEPPTHPQLLDWLALEYVRNGWDTKALLRLIVTSATFRQESKDAPDGWHALTNGKGVGTLDDPPGHALPVGQGRATQPTISRNALASGSEDQTTIEPDAGAFRLTADPDNRLLARGPRFRLSAETIRDQALVIGGLLVERIGGPSVKPYQPPGLWEQVSYNAEQVYEQDHGDSLYRRSMYTFWKRQAPPPSMLTFDSPTRETCLVRRPRTNTPLQSLVLLNDVTFVEAARGLATRLLQRRELTTADRLQLGFRMVTSRSPSDRELISLTRLFDAQVAEYRQHAEAARQLLSVGESPIDSTLPEPDLAALTLVANLLLNLDETVTMH